MTTNFRTTVDSYRARRGEIRVVEVPPLQYLMVDGHGDPNSSPAYGEALQALYPLAYTLKFASRDLGQDYVVPPLEGLWWAPDMSAFTTGRDKSAWSWTLMLMTPHWLTAEHVAAAHEKVAATKPAAPLERVRLAVLDEGLCVQTLHVGSFDDEGPVLADLHGRFMREHGLVMIGKHHEIYLSDPRRTAADRLRTILRQPVRSVDGGLEPARSAVSRRTVGSSSAAPTSPAGDTEEDAVTESPATPPDGPHPQGSGIREDAPTLSGLPDDAPDELRATLTGGDLGHIPADVDPAEPDR